MRSRWGCAGSWARFKPSFIANAFVARDPRLVRHCEAIHEAIHLAITDAG